MAETSSAGSSTPSSPASDLPSPHSADELAWTGTAAQSQTTKDVLQSVLRVRKTWKTLRGGETVWPPALEAALVEGLEKYVPDDSRETRMLGRFPRRNRFLSDYIFAQTGTRRSAKQVGSRLQQLRESCGGPQLLHLLSPFREPAYCESAASSDSASALNSPVSPLPGDSLFGARPAPPPHTVIYIDILPPPTGAPDSLQRSSEHEHDPWPEAGAVVHASPHPRALAAINPTIAFTARAPLAAHSQFSVYSGDVLLHVERAALHLLSPPPPQADPAPPDALLYSTRLVPAYWDTILASPDPTRFTILQDVVRDDTAAAVFSATYKFRYGYPPDSWLPPPTSSPALVHHHYQKPEPWLLPSPSSPGGGPAPQPYTLPAAPSLYDGAAFWHPPAPRPYARAPSSSESASPPRRYPSPSRGRGASASDCFPSDLSNYVSYA
ncbi:hypothetical protein B0H15DRAFT_807937 [Mycena belliarum]|uniref:TEA domain-containing protein n=1 Tax=Mycena belliarum TaxID=1033014 RepID=A0AAD6UMN0_9AGAR|nr:hypothetical protein B0H15DRAFT_807937 [Mycena belliae]